MRNGMTAAELTDELAACRFALIDLTLFLDTHPTDAAALSRFAELRDDYARLAALYAQHIGPLTMADAQGEGGVWNWNRDPLPGEGGN